MGKYNGAVITAAGQNLIAQAIAESKTVTFTTAQASSHVYPSSTDFEALTALTDVEKTVDINYAGVYSDTVVQVSARFDNDGVETAYLINTLGFFAQLGTDTPILFAVSTAVTPDQMPVFDADNSSAFIYNMQITVQNADSINVSVNPAGTVTVDQLNTVVSALQIQINGKVNLSGITDNLNETSAISGDVLSAHQGNVLAELAAPVQTNLTAKQDYYTGDSFIYNGLLYVFTMNTAQDETIIINGNCRPSDRLTKSIKDKTTWKTGPSTTDKTTSISIPPSANEIIVEVQYRTSIYFSIPLSRPQFSKGGYNFYDAGSVLPSNSGEQKSGVRIQVHNLSVSVNLLYFNEGTENFKMTIYYK